MPTAAPVQTQRVRFIEHRGVGMEGIHRVLYRAVLLFSRRSIETFDDLDAARDWLASQK